MADHIGRMHLEVLQIGPLDTNVYVLFPEESEEAIVIDAPENTFSEVAPLLERYGRKKVSLFITHGHLDHVLGVHDFVKELDALIYAHKGDQSWIENPMIMGFLFPFAEDAKGAKINVLVEEGQVLAIGGEKIEVRYVPGHSPGSVVYYFPSRKWAFVGDLIFAGGVGRSDLPGGSFQELERSIRQKVYTLSEDTVLYPGHGASTTVAVEKKTNLYVREVK